MVQKKENILTINAGSSSIKLDLFLVNRANAEPERVLEASITGIGLPRSIFSVQQHPGDKQTKELAVSDQAAAIDELMQWLAESVPIATVTAIGHRIVHGGPNFTEPELVTAAIERELQTFVEYDQEHANAALQLIRSLRQKLPEVPQVVCFDTAFSHAMPRVAQLLPIPRKYQALGLRRYGFHGLSYTYLLSAFRTMAGEDAAKGRIIFAHLGSGVSLTATKDGKAVDTTMGFTPASGIMMSSRSGDLDPGVIGFLHRKVGMSIKEYDHMVNFESGLLGVSELSADMYTLLQQESTQPQAAEAISLFVYQVKQAIGALSTTLGGLDSVVFSGGIGEQSAVLRARIATGLDFLGIDLDETRNQQPANLISKADGRVGVYVIPTDEAQVIAREVIATLTKHQT